VVYDIVKKIKIATERWFVMEIVRVWNEQIMSLAELFYEMSLWA
jgi:hypothetical protein